MKNIDKKQFGNFIAQLRKENNMTQSELAEKLNISAKAVSKWETGVSLNASLAGRCHCLCIADSTIFRKRCILHYSSA